MIAESTLSTLGGNDAISTAHVCEQLAHLIVTIVVVLRMKMASSWWHWGQRIESQFVLTIAVASE